jgi:PAS domain S-box-containing protein
VTTKRPSGEAAAPPGDLLAALRALDLPVFVVGRDQTVTWLNPAAAALVGDVAGKRFTDVVAPESRSTVADAFAQKLVGSARSTMYEATFLLADGSRRRAEVSSVPLEEHGHVVGVFGVVVPVDEAPTRRQLEEMLTPREAQALQLLARGCSTEQLAAQMGISRETVRNHIRSLLKKLDVHSRLEAVVEARSRGLV